MPKSKSQTLTFKDREFEFKDEKHGFFRLVNAETGKSSRYQLYAYEPAKSRASSLFMTEEIAKQNAKKVGLKIVDKTTKPKAVGGKKMGKKKIGALVHLCMKHGATQEEIEKLGFPVEEKKAPAKGKGKPAKAEESEAEGSEEPEERPAKPAKKAGKKAKAQKKPTRKSRKDEEEEASEEDEE